MMLSIVLLAGLSACGIGKITGEDDDHSASAEISGTVENLEPIAVNVAIVGHAEDLEPVVADAEISGTVEDLEPIPVNVAIVGHAEDLGLAVADAEIQGQVAETIPATADARVEVQISE
jgi:hypothetical protein